MKIKFSETDPEKIVATLKDVMGGRELAKIVSFDLANDQLTVTIKKVGKSILTFSADQSDSGVECSLVKEKIALSHKAFKGEVTKKIFKVIEKAGGVVEE